MTRLRDLNLLIARGDELAIPPAPVRAGTTDEQRRRIAAGMREYVAGVRQSRAVVTEAAVREWQQLPPVPVNGADFRAMFDARLVALKAWHKRVMDATGCTRRDAEYACYRARLRFEPRNTHGTNGRNKR